MCKLGETEYSRKTTVKQITFFVDFALCNFIVIFSHQKLEKQAAKKEGKCNFWRLRAQIRKISDTWLKLLKVHEGSKNLMN